MSRLLLVLIFLSLFGHIKAQSLRKLLDESETLVFSHRAALSPDIPENSLYSMQKSLSAGITMHEVDLAESKDGVLFLLHDQTLDRTTEGSGALKEKTSAQLKEVKLLGLSENIPTFESALQFAKEHGIYLMLDVKEAPLQKVIDLVEKYDMLGHILVLTFQEDRAQEALDLKKPFLLSVLIREEDDLDFYLCKTDNPYLLAAYLNKGATLDLYAKTKDLGMPIITDVMGEIDDSARDTNPQVYLDFIEPRKPDILVTDYPLVLRSVLQN